MKQVIAIDIGGTKTHGALIDEQGTMIKDHRIPTNPALGPDALLSSLFALIDELKSGEDVMGIGIASAGRIDIERGEVFYSTDNIPGWSGVKLRAILEEAYQLPVFVDDDVNAAGPGEEWLGAAKGYDSYVLIALGTGIGGAVKVNGSLLRGAHWSAGELGHMILYPHGRHCNCGLDGCFEQYCSGTALVKRYHTLAQDTIKDGYALFALVEAKDPIACQVIEEFVDDLATAILSITNMFDPQILLIGGGLIDTKDYWWQCLMDKIADSPLAKIFMPRIEPAKLGNQAALYGAAYLAFAYLKTQS